MEKSVRKLISQDQQGNSEYVILIKEGSKSTKYELYASQSELWNDSTKGELLMVISDDGNGVKLDEKYKELDYSQVKYLRILLSINNLDATMSDDLLAFTEAGGKIYLV